MNIIKTDKFYQRERILSNDHPVHYGYIYICDSIIVFSDIEGTVKDLKQDTKCTEVRKCDIGERDLWEFYQ